MLAATQFTLDWSAVPALALACVALLLFVCFVLLPLFVWQIYRNTRRTRIATERMLALHQVRMK